MTYGCEIIDYSETNIADMEKAHRQAARRIQNIPKCTPNPATIEGLGWWPIEAIIDRKKLVFARKILSGVSNIYKTLVIFLHTVIQIQPFFATHRWADIRHSKMFREV